MKSMNPVQEPKLYVASPDNPFLFPKVCWGTNACFVTVKSNNPIMVSEVSMPGAFGCTFVGIPGNPNLAKISLTRAL